MIDAGRNKKAKHLLTHSDTVKLMLLAYDAVILNIAFFAALWIRFDCRFAQIPVQYMTAFLKFTPIYTLSSVLVYYFCHLYNSIWRFAGFAELINCGLATVICFILQCVGITLLFKRMPITYYVFGIVLQFIFTIGIRFAYRFVLLLRGARAKNEEGVSRVMLIGAGEAGKMLIQDTVTTARRTEKIVCIIDDNKNKWNREIAGVPVVGGREEILRAAEKYRTDKIYFAIPSAKASDKREILNICKETGCELKQLPGIYQLLDGTVTLGNLRNVDIEDLLGREPIRVNMAEVYAFIKDKTVMVTGGGGSIGSELCRQVAAHEPKRLIIFDVYENSAYATQLELKAKYPALDLVTLIGSVRDSRRLDQVFRDYRPDIVYHAAAHKHVPLMEDSPCESIKNNAIGTYKTAYAALRHGCRRFVLISTDKAVNPTNIMGASKRLCEMVVQCFDRKVKQQRVNELPALFTHDEAAGYINEDSATEFVAVRFGNVLGSNGSVVPLFKRQIAAGGPVTVTHPDIIRYFMTVQEAVSLVLQAGINAGGGEIFVLDMGEPVKIDTMARNLIRLSGLVPDVDIKIEYTGLRPGEKLYEEKLMAEEGLKRTDNELIHVGMPIAFDEDEFLAKLGILTDAAYGNDEDSIRRIVADMVPTYHYDGEAVTV